MHYSGYLSNLTYVHYYEEFVPCSSKTIGEDGYFGFDHVSNINQDVLNFDGYD